MLKTPRLIDSKCEKSASKSLKLMKNDKKYYGHDRAYNKSISVR